MKDKTARVIAILALIFMAVFISSLTAAFAVQQGTVVSIFSYISIGSGAVALALFTLIKMSGRGYSITEMNNEIEMEKIRKENEAQLAAAQAEAERAEKEAQEPSEKADEDDQSTQP